MHLHAVWHSCMYAYTSSSSWSWEVRKADCCKLCTLISAKALLSRSWLCSASKVSRFKRGRFSLYTYAVVLDAYPNTATVKQGSTLVLVCRVVGVPSTTVLSYQWTCPGGSCDAGAVDPEWAAKVQQGNILVVNVRRHDDGGSYNCTVWDRSQQVGVVQCVKL